MKKILTDEDFTQIERETFAGYERYRAIEAAIIERIGDAVAEIDEDDSGMWSELLPDRNLKRGPLYAIPFKEDE